MKKLTTLRLEFLFIMLGVAIAALILFPIRHAEIDFPLYGENALLIILSVVLFKHIFLLRYSWLNQIQKLKIAIIPFSIILIVFLIRMLNAFTTYVDERSLADLMLHLSYERQRFFVNYIRTEYVMFAVVAIIGSIILPFRLLISVWKEVNRKP